MSNINSLQFKVPLSKDNEEYNLEYGKDYDFIVETFFAEYKLDKDEIKKCIMEFQHEKDPIMKGIIEDRLKILCPEYSLETLLTTDIDILSDTVVKKVYFVQSPKGPDGLPSIHYSLKEKFLSDFRAQRGKVKKLMAIADHNHDKLGSIRYNAKQLAIKVVCNSEYGASNNSSFSHYDPDIAAAVTFSARQLIAFLTSLLESKYIYVDQKFITEQQTTLDVLTACGLLRMDNYEGDKKTIFDNRRRALWRLFDENFNVVSNDIKRLELQPSTVIYQDTDSNYYINDYVIDKFTKNRTEISPEIVDNIMNVMLNHNNLLATLAAEIVKRRPIGLGFEGSFEVCRYLNRKKKYYGIKWSEDGSVIPSTRLCDDAYENGVLKANYDKFWSPKKTVLPMTNGEYIYLDTKKLLRDGVNYLDYAKSYNVKCTGVDLARRDQYKFINFFHLMILQKDLRLMKYLGNNEWKIFQKDEEMKSIIENIIESYRNIIDCYANIAAFINSKLPEIQFQAMDFAKTAAHREGKQNSVTHIVARLRAEGKEQYIAPIGERMSFIVLLDKKTQEERLAGKAGSGNTSTRSFVVDEVMDIIKSEMPESEFQKYIKNDFNISYDEWINAKVISMLDHKYYFECLCNSIALYIIGDVYPDIIKKIDNGEMRAIDANTEISKMRKEIANHYVKLVYRSGNDIKKELKVLNTDMPKKGKVKDVVGDVQLLLQVYDEFDKVEDITPAARDAILKDCYRSIEDCTNKVNCLEKMYRVLVCDAFIGYKCKSEFETVHYNKYKDNIKGLVAVINTLKSHIQQYESIKIAAERLKFK